MYLYDEDEEFEGMRSGFDRIVFTISPYNFEISFNLFTEIIKSLVKIEAMYLIFCLNSNYRYLLEEEDIAAVLSAYPETYGLDPHRIGQFYDIKRKMIFSIVEDPIKEIQRRKHERIITMKTQYQLQDVSYNCIIDFTESLLDKGIIIKNDI